jgi:hypothetical protein
MNTYHYKDISWKFLLPGIWNIPIPDWDAVGFAIRFQTHQGIQWEDNTYIGKL